MRIRILKEYKNAFIEEVHHVSEIKETTKKFIFKRFFSEGIIEVKKEELFFFEINGILVKKGGKN